MDKEDLVVGWAECDEVLRKRYEEAFNAGLKAQQALEWACSTADVSELRKCVQGGCSPRLIARIVL